ncbi:hypothetical protein V493_00539 [Pseudogymnoascus sp. VKM F-4281 (FW-2241)]|nr:hypothetical protein V493_00539 [Pseudogymnoascus sp. VKM F-4281 (FW-2241)]
MDPLSLTLSIVAVVQLTGAIIGCLNDLKETSSDRAQCSIEISNVSNLLVRLIYRLDEGSSNDGWYVEMQALAAANGPIDQYRSALEQLKSKFTSGASSKLKKIGIAVSWQFSKEEVANILTRIERLKSLIHVALEMDHFKLSQALKTDTTVITNTVRSMQESQVTEQYRTITNWLSSTDFPAQQSDFISRRQEGTGEWFVVSPEFTNWLQGTKQDLFCPGIPGAGKTMIAAIAVDHLWKVFQGDNVGIAYIYCNYKRQETQTTKELLAAILKQLVQECPSYGESVTALHKLHIDRRTSPSLDEICTALKSVLSNYSKAYIIIDALDECTDSDGTRSELLTILRSLQAKTDTRLMATSRFVSKIEQLFQGTPMLEIRASDADVKRYVFGQLHRLPMCIQRDPELQAETQGGIVLAVDGMFLLARLHIDSLRGKTTKKAVRSTLKKLPRGSAALEKAYDEAIERIESQLPEESELAKSVLSWITYAMRQLTTKELSHALAVEEGESELDEDNIPDIEDVISVCAGLVTVDEESDVIRLVHYTTQEYFERVREVWNPKAQEEIASTCLTYLSFKTFSTARSENYDNFEYFFGKIEQNPFLDYASRYWGKHALTVQQTIKELALPFLRDMNQLSYSSQVMLVKPYSIYDYSKRMPTNLTGLHITALLGLAYLLQELTDSNGDKNSTHIDVQDSHNRTPLSWAAEGGQGAIVKLLIERDVVADSKDNESRTPLWWAARNGHEALVKLLVERDDVIADSKCSNGQTPLSGAAWSGNEAAVKLLVERNDVVADSKDNEGRTPLSWAAAKGREATVKLLIERDDVVADSKDNESRTPLWWAARNGHMALVKLLVERDDVIADSKCSNGQTPLSGAAWSGNEAAVKLLVERNDVVADSKDNEGRTPLSWAAAKGREATVKLLIERDDVVADSKDNESRTPLWWAARNGHEALVKLLVERDDVIADSKCSNGQTPLSGAAWSGNEAAVKLLVERDDVVADSKDNESRTPLLRAAMQGREAVVKLLAERNDVAADSKDINDQTPLYWAARNGHVAVVKLLAERDDVIVDWKDKNGQTPLSGAAYEGREAVVKLLINRDDVIVDYKEVNYVSRTPLSFAAEGGSEAVVKLFLERDDVTADSWDDRGWTPLAWAAEEGTEAVMKVFLERDDVAVDSEDIYGQTPLSIAAYWKSEAVVKLLLERDDVVGDSKDWTGRTPLSHAAESGEEAIVKLLVERDDVVADSTDEDGRTPLSFAAGWGNEAVVKLLISRDDVNVESKDVNGHTPLWWAESREDWPDMEALNAVKKLLREHKAKGGKAETGVDHIGNPPEDTLITA